MPQVIFDKKNILIIGGAGFIGSHLCEELVKEAKIICVDNFSSSSESNIEHLLPNPDFVFINHDISLPLDLESRPELKKFKVAFQGIQEIYYLACPTSPKHFIENRLGMLLSNSLGIKNALDLTLKYQAKLLHFSSSVVYGPRPLGTSIKIKEDFQGIVNHLSDRSAYDEGKRFAETMVKNYRDIYNLDTKIIRVFRTYGPRMNLHDDQMLPDFILSAMNNENLVIFGDENFSSSFCYVTDIVDAAIKMMASNFSGPINVGSDEDVKLSSIAQMIVAELGSSSSIIYSEKKMFMSELPLPDITIAKNELSWMPVVTLSNGLKKTIFDLQAKKQLKGFSS